MKIGSLVICVKHSPLDRHLIKPDFDKIYTVRGFVWAGTITGSDDHNEWIQDYNCIYLEEIINDTVKYGYNFDEDPYLMDCFREVLPPIANIETHIKENTLEPQPI